MFGGGRLDGGCGRLRGWVVVFAAAAVQSDGWEGDGGKKWQGGGKKQWWKKGGEKEKEKDEDA